MAPTCTDMVLLMGVTGSGKSHFINQLVRGAVEEGHDITSETKKCCIVQAQINDEQSIALIDTPGFDDSFRSDAEVFQEIAEFLALQHMLGIRLKGIIYLHRITDIKMPGSGVKYLNIFRSIVGEKALSNVVLATTMWDKVDVSEGLRREQQLRETFWSGMEDKGSHIALFDGSPEMAEEMLIELSAKRSIVLQLQREICDQHRSLDQTTAASVFLSDVDRGIADYDTQLVKLDKRIRNTRDEARRKQMQAEHDKLRRDRRREARRREALRRRVDTDADQKIARAKGNSKLQSGVAILAAIIGVTVNLLVTFLPIS